MKKNPEVSFVIINWNGKKITRECIQSIERISYRNYEIIVVDNGSSDGSREMIKKEFPKVRVIENHRNVGAPKATNQGIRASRGKYVFRMDNDTEIMNKDILETLISMMERDDRIGLIGCKLIYPSGANQFASGYVDSFGIARHYYNDEERDTLGLCTAGMFIRKSITERIGHLDEGFSPMFFEDLEYTIRAKKMGYKTVYTPRAVLFHKEHGNIKKSDMKFRSFIISKARIRYMLLHFSIPRLIFALPFEIPRIFFHTLGLKVQYLVKSYLINLLELNDIIRRRNMMKARYWNENSDNSSQ